MLVLSRKIGESIELLNSSSTEPLVIPPGGKIGEVFLVDVRGQRVRLGAEFPDTVRIKRQEIPAIKSDQPAVIDTGRSSEDVAVPASEHKETNLG